MPCEACPKMGSLMTGNIRHYFGLISLAWSALEIPCHNNVGSSTFLSEVSPFLKALKDLGYGYSACIGANWHLQACKGLWSSTGRWWRASINQWVMRQGELLRTGFGDLSTKVCFCGLCLEQYFHALSYCGHWHLFQMTSFTYVSWNHNLSTGKELCLIYSHGLVNLMEPVSPLWDTLLIWELSSPGKSWTAPHEILPAATHIQVWFSVYPDPAPRGNLAWQTW